MMIFLGVMLILLAFAGYMFARNESLYKYMTGLLDEVAVASEADENAGRDWEWRFDALNAVSYNEMFLKFWRRFDSFYPNQAFADISGRDYGV